MSRIAVAGLQLALSSTESNLPLIRARIDALMKVFPWVEMVVLSELCIYGHDLIHAEPLPGPAEQTLCALAAQHRLWLIPGSMFERAAGRIYNTCSVIDPSGRVVGRYRKLFPFRPYEAEVEAGEEFLVFEVPGVGRFGVSICYDLWFPETTRTLAAMGAEVILHPAMTTTIDRDVELAMARASAAMHQVYVVDINGVGEGGNGRSIVCGPAGEVLHQAGTAEERLPLELDLELVRRSRERGLLNLGQPLKSFRERKVAFRLYQHEDDPAFAPLQALGPLVTPGRNRGGS